MATIPPSENPPGKSPSEERAQSEQEMLMREVDEAVRQDEVGDFARKHGRKVALAVVLGFAAFGGYLFWQGQQEGELEGRSEALVKALDELNAGNVQQSDEELAAIAGGEGGTAAMARMLRGGLALQQGRADEAAAFYDQVANDVNLPGELRDVARIRSVAAQFDQLDPQQVIARIGPLAVADSPYYGSAGEIVAHAYLAQGKNEEAGALLAEMAKNEDVPISIRDRARRLAGLLGIDTIEDVDATLAEVTGEPLPGAGAAE